MSPERSSRNQLRDIARRAMRERGLLAEFSPAVLAQTAVARAVPHDQDQGVRDLRQLPWCSIDNDDSRDLDQLSVAEALQGGATKVLVAIADVDALVAEGSPVDAHARANTTSVYTAAEIFPMLPEPYSTDLTSLNEGEDRLAIVVEMRVLKSGEVDAADIYRARVHNRAQLAYNSVAAWLEGQGPAPAKLAAVPGLAENLRLQDAAAEALRGVRRQHGALDLDTQEARAVFDGEELRDLRREERNRAKGLIEDFMVAANGATARFLERKNYPSLRRVLRSPKRWERIVALAAECGEKLPGEPDSAALEAFLKRRRQADPDHFPDLSLSVVKLLGKGEYALELPGQAPPGHFGLAVRDYTHSTAPNRRYPDLTTQRLLKAALAGKPPPPPGGMAELAQHCTQQEDAATKVERQVRKSAAALLLSSRIGQRFDAIVTGASSKGTYVRIFSPPAEGRVVEGFEGLDVGDKTRVALLSTDVERGYVDFGRSA